MIQHIEVIDCILLKEIYGVREQNVLGKQCKVYYKTQPHLKSSQFQESQNTVKNVNTHARANHLNVACMN